MTNQFDPRTHPYAQSPTGQPTNGAPNSLPPPLGPLPTEKPKRPWYKKWWTWTIVAILVVGVWGLNQGEKDSSRPEFTAVEAVVEEEPELTAEELAEQQSRDAAEAAAQAEADKKAEEEEAARVAEAEAAQKAADEAAAKAKADADRAANMTLGQKNAVRQGRNYLEFISFSRQSLIDQLVFEGFSEEDATFAVDEIAPDWNEQAARKAGEYLDFTAFSRQGLIDQLVYEGFTYEQAEYGVTAVGY